MMMFLKIITFPFWFPLWLWKTSIKLGIAATLIGAGYVYFKFFYGA